MRSAFLSRKEYRDFARWAARAKREEHKNIMLQMADHWMQTRKNWSASTPIDAFHRGRTWRRRRPRKTTLGKGRRRTISRVRVDDLLLAFGSKRDTGPGPDIERVMDRFGRGLPALHPPKQSAP
jgi:hypothetical protein